MPSDDLDLERGIPDDPRTARRRARRAGSSTPKETERDRPKPVTDTELRNQLGRAFDGLVKNREKRDDEELAEAIREEADAMTEGFVTLTDAVKVLRMPIIIVLNLLITLLAFGRVGGILFTRIGERRARKIAEAQAAANESPFPIEDQ